jgi:hypothetical protein
MVTTDTVRSCIPEEVTHALQRGYDYRNQVCPVCGSTPARRLTLLYGVRSVFFPSVQNDVRNYITVCEACWFRYRDTDGTLPERNGEAAKWLNFTKSLCEDLKAEPRWVALAPWGRLFTQTEPEGSGTASLPRSLARGFAAEIEAHLTLT